MRKYVLLLGVILTAIAALALLQTLFSQSALAARPSPETFSSSFGNWQTDIVDSAGNVGRWPSMALDSYGRPHIRG
ncbi:MAG: hypothetical protein GY796_16095 [Chloroflexi bacterium]|nr:hypothetical protein [Chloroflexota bacterium]